MKIYDVLAEMKKGDKAFSYTWNLEITHDDNIVISNCPDYPHLEGKTLELSGMVMGIEDFKIFPRKIKDLNYVKDVLRGEIKSKGLILIKGGTTSYRFNKDNIHTTLDFLSLDNIVNGVWLEGDYSNEELRNFGFLPKTPKPSTNINLNLRPRLKAKPLSGV